MGGVDASAGFAYQHAQAVHRVLELVSIDDSGYVRVEAKNDVVDVETYSTDGVLRRAAQFKVRDQKYTWGKADLLDELARWSMLGSKHPEARYEFVTDGRLGPDGRKVQRALDATRTGEVLALTELANDRNVTLDFEACSRASICAGTAGFDQLIDTAIDRAAGLLPHVTGELEAEERATQLVHALLRMIVGRSGKSDPEARVITKTELDALLSDRREFVGTESWSTDVKQAFIESVRARPPKGIVLQCESGGTGTGRGGSGNPSRHSLLDLVGHHQVPVLSGPTGTGKSTVTYQAQAVAADRGEIAIVVDAEGYVPKRLGSLVARGINATGFVGAYSATGLRALNDPTVALIIDGVSEISAEARDALKSELKQLLASEVRAKLVLVGRDPTILQSVLPRHTKATPIRVEHLDRKRRLEILAELSNGRIVSRDAQVLAAQVEDALRGAADNPQLFVVGASLVYRGCSFTNPGSMYQQYVHARAEGDGYTNITALEVGLGIAFAALADTGRRYCDSFEWTEQLKTAAAVLQADGHEVTTADLRDFGRESGMIIRPGGDVIRAVHDSFADYFAATAHARAMAPLPLHLQPGDSARIRFLAELAGMAASLSAQVASDLPFLIPAVAEREVQQPSEAWHDATQVLVALLWPADVTVPRIAYWESAGNLMVTVNGSLEGWLGDRTLTEVGIEAFTFRAVGGPLSVAAKIWRHRLRALLDIERRHADPIPATHEQTVQMLTAFSDTVVDTVLEMGRQVAPAGHLDSVMAATARCRIQFALGPATDSRAQHERPLQYRNVDSRERAEVVDLEKMAIGPDESWPGGARVDSFLSENPKSTAAQIVSEAINQLAGHRWV
ncbi:ATP-binding protein [Rhodococcus oryzae]|uniref:ATP-binding protein n=1 Tax=Rhodococcus oryzae TaxID=2571143 RepID=UPI00379C3E98